MEQLRLEGVTKAFGDTLAVDDVTLSVRRGEFVTLLGASGCGKTTLLRIIAGFLAPDRGGVRFEGRGIDHLAPRQRGFGFVFQAYALFPTKTIFDNIAFGLRVRRWDRRRTRARVEELCDLVQLDGLESRFPHELSGGQQQRVALARALAPEPPLLLLDEPLSALDARIRERLRHELRRLVNRLGVTAIYVTHDQAEALQISDRIAVMRAGRIEQAGSPPEIYLRPRSRFVAEFVGTVSVLACTRRPLNRLRPAGWSDSAQLVALRPEHVRVSVPGPGDDRECLADVESSSFMGPVYRLVLRFADGQSVVADVPSEEWEGVGKAASRVAVALHSHRAIALGEPTLESREVA
jgi:ABC-type Fe3+/spermidine/putrescine transport system ATPase subunit